MGFFSQAMGVGGNGGEDESGEAQDANKRPFQDKGKAKRHYDRLDKEVQKENEDKGKGDEPRDGKIL